MNVDEFIDAGAASIENLKAQFEVVSRLMSPTQKRAMRLVFLKLDEARLWLGEVAR